MAFFGLGDKVRKDPMGPSTMGVLKTNADFVRRLSLSEHTSDGEHNTREVPRVVRRISGTTVSPSSSDITAVTNPTTGTYVLTLAAGRFDSAFITCQINACGAGVASKPYLSAYKVVSSTSIEVYFLQMAAVLGDTGGNTWNVANVDFDIAIHSEPVTVGSYSTALPANSLRGDPLKPTRWNALVQNAADVHAVLTVEHLEGGEHNTRQVASYAGLWRYDGAGVSLESGVASDLSISRSSAGVFNITCSKTLTTQAHCFVAPETMRLNGGDGTELYRMHVVQSSTTAFVLYSYKYNRTLSTWDRYDGDFWLAVHSG